MSTAETGGARQCLVELSRAERWVRIVLSVGEPYTGGGLVAFAPGAQFAVEATNELSGTYQRSNWLSGVISGARYALRALNLPRWKVWLSDLSGKIGSDDMGGLAVAAVIAVARLSGKDPPQLELDGWTVVRAEVLGQQSEDARGREAVA